MQHGSLLITVYSTVQHRTQISVMNQLESAATILNSTASSSQMLEDDQSHDRHHDGNATSDHILDVGVHQLFNESEFIRLNLGPRRLDTALLMSVGYCLLWLFGMAGT